MSKKKFTIENGMLFNEVLATLESATQLRKNLDFQKNVKSYKLNGHEIFVPKALRAPDHKLDKKLIGSMELEGFEDNEHRWFLQDSTRCESISEFM